MRYIIVITLSVVLSSCAYLRAITFVEDEKSGTTEPQITKLYLIGPKAASPTIDAKQFGDPAFEKALATCVPKPPGPGPMEPISAILIGFAVEQGISMITDALAALVDELREKSQRTYATSVILADPGHLEETTCLVVVRGSAAESAPGVPKTVGLALVLKLERIGVGRKDAVTIQPIYVHLRNAVAITGKGKPVSIAVALAGKAARVKDNIRKVDVFAQATLTLADVPLGKVATDLPEPSGLVPLAPTDSSSIELSVGITESGTGIPDTEKAKAEIKALAAALKPALIEHAKSLVN